MKQGRRKRVEEIMYHIGICDDDPIFIKYIKRLFCEVQREIEFYEYLSGEALIQDMQTRESYDLLILDMQLPGMDGNETAKRGTVLHCTEGKGSYSSPKKLAEFYEQLKNAGFAYAHNSYIVNLEHVVEVGPKELEFVNGERLTISRARAKEFKKAFAVQLSQKYER